MSSSSEINRSYVSNEILQTTRRLTKREIWVKIGIVRRNPRKNPLVFPGWTPVDMVWEDIAKSGWFKIFFQFELGW